MIFRIQFYLHGGWQTMDTAAEGISPGPIVERHLQEYTWSFRSVSAYDRPRWPKDTPVRLLTGDTESGLSTLFRGTISRDDRQGDSSAEGITYICESWWNAITKETLELNGIPRVTYNAREDDPLHDPDRRNKSVQEILEDVLALVIDTPKTLEEKISEYTEAKFKQAWAGFAFDDDLDVVPPRIAFDAKNLQEVIVELLKWMPDVYMTMNRDTGLFTFSRRSSLATRNLHLLNFDSQADPVPIESVRIRQRIDILVPRIILKFPNRVDYREAYIDSGAIVGTPDYLTGIPQTLIQLNDLQFQVTNPPLNQVFEVIGGGQYTVSLPSGILTFREKPTDFFVWYEAESSQTTYDTGFGGTGFDVLGIDKPVMRRYLGDFPIVTRKFWVLAIDGDWLLAPAFGEMFPDPEMWPRLIGAAISKVGGPSATILEIANHQFNSITLGSAVALLGVGIRASGLGLAPGDQVAVVVEDNTESITKMADSFWKALRDIRYAGEIPAFRWMPELKLGERVNLINTHDPVLANMQESIFSLEFSPVGLKTQITLFDNPHLELDDLLRLVREKLGNTSYSPSSFIGGSGGAGGTSQGALRVHRHNTQSAQDGGDILEPRQIAQSGATGADGEYRNGTLGTGVRIKNDALLIGDINGNYTQIREFGIEIKKDGKKIVIGVIGGILEIEIDGIAYLFDHDSKRKLSAKVR